MAVSFVALVTLGITWATERTSRVWPTIQEYSGPQPKLISTSFTIISGPSISFQIYAPAMTTASCGRVDGDDHAGYIYVDPPSLQINPLGEAVAQRLPCTLNFAFSYFADPVCIVVSESDNDPGDWKESKRGIRVPNVLAGDLLFYDCVARW